VGKHRLVVKTLLVYIYDAGTREGQRERKVISGVRMLSMTREVGSLLVRLVSPLILSLSLFAPLSL